MGIQLFVQGLVTNSRISFDLSNLSVLGIYTAIAFFCIGLMLVGISLFISGLLTFFYGFRPGFRHVLGVLFLASVYISVSVWQLNCRKEEESRKLLAQKVEERQDHVAEYLFDEAATRIAVDSQIIQAYRHRPVNIEAIKNRLSTEYLTGYLGKFDNTISVFDSSGTPVDTLI